MPRVVVAGLRGGTGKTTLSLGLMAALRGRGIRVAPFKKGPDYIDAGWLAAAAGAPCHNLDPFLIGEDHVLASFREHAAGSGCAVIEGNRGLFDGMDAEGRASTARVARLLRTPVLLVLDCRKATRTLAALVLGAKRFERGLRIGGVVLNRVAGTRHETVVRTSVEQYTGVPVLGALPRLREEEMPERHMGLVPREEHGHVEDVVRRAAAAVESHVDLEAVLALAGSAPAIRRGEWEHEEEGAEGDGPSIGVIRDSAFQFYYPENLEELTRRGARIMELSALRAGHLPDLDALYIGGGFPETHAIALARNRPLLRSIREAVEEGLPVYAECGGLMYLGQALELAGRRHEMAGVFPVTFSLHARPQAHGYTVVKVTRKNPFYQRGTVLRGHEFHYSRVEGEVSGTLAFRMDRGTGIQGGRDGLVYRNVLGTYTHVHALGAPEWAEGVLRAARAHRRKAAR